MIHLAVSLKFRFTDIDTKRVTHIEEHAARGEILGEKFRSELEDRTVAMDRHPDTGPVKCNAQG